MENKETLAKYRRKQGNMSLFFREQGNKTLQIRGRKHCKQIHYKGNKYGKRAGTWEHRAILEENTEQGPSLGDPQLQRGRYTQATCLATLQKVEGRSTFLQLATQQLQLQNGVLHGNFFLQLATQRLLRCKLQEKLLRVT